MRAVVSLLAVLVVIGSGCDNGDSGQREKAAIKAVFDTQQGQFVSHQFPAKPKSVRCVIRGGPDAPDIRQPGTCATLVSINPVGSAVVLFRETWFGANFALYGASCTTGHGSCMADRRRRMHTWDFTVTKEGQIVSFDHYGDLPPQFVQ